MLHTIGVAYSLALLAIAGYVGWTFYSNYKKESSPTVWGRILAATHDSETIIITKFTTILAAVVANLDKFADFIGQPEIKDFINNWVGDPKAIATIMLIIAIITYKGRMART